MHHYSRIFALIVLLVVSVFPVKAATLFPDISESDPDYASIQYVHSHHIMTGSEDGQFHPNLPLTRCELAKIVVLASEFLPLTGEHEQDFSDLPLDHWCDSYAHLLKHRNILSGYPDGTFRPNQKVSQIEALKILFNSRYISMNVWSVRRDLYSDVHAGDWWAPYISLAQGREIAYHRSGNKYGIQEPMTRKEAAHILWRLSTLFPVINGAGMRASDSNMQLYSASSMPFSFEYPKTWAIEDNGTTPDSICLASSATLAERRKPWPTQPIEADSMLRQSDICISFIPDTSSQIGPWFDYSKKGSLARLLNVEEADIEMLGTTTIDEKTVTKVLISGMPSHEIWYVGKGKGLYIIKFRQIIGDEPLTADELGIVYSLKLLNS